MNFWRPKRRDEQDEPGLAVFEVDTSLLARKTIYDSMIGNPTELAVLVGLSPISDEVDAMEREASADRLSRMSGLTALIAFEASLVAQAAIKFQVANLANIDDHTVELIEEAYSAVAFSASVATLSNLLDLDIVRLAGD